MGSSNRLYQTWFVRSDLTFALLWAGAFCCLALGRDCGLDSSPALATRFGQVPLMFLPAETASDEASAFLARGPGYEVRLSPGRVELSCQAASDAEASPASRREHQPPASRNGRSRLRLRLRLLNANTQAEAQAEQYLPTRVNYFVGNNPRSWRTNLPTHARVRYIDVFPGVDLLFYGNQRQLEHDFIVGPGIDPAQIRWGLEGADRAEIEPDGTLAVWVGASAVRLCPPLVYQDTEGERRWVTGAYRLEQDRPLIVGFQLGPYDRSRPLIIDPVLVYATYLGGLGYEQASGVAVDRDGQVYVVGETSSLDFPINNALWPTNGGGFTGSQNPYGNDAFVAKLGAEGTNLVFASYLGGEGVDVAIAVALDQEGSPYITGLTASTNFPVTPDALNTRLAGESRPIDEYPTAYYFNDVFVAKLSPEGDALLYSTFIGGADDDLGLTIALGETGAVYVAGDTGSEDFPLRNSSAEFKGQSDAFVLKFIPGNEELDYSVLLGGGDYDSVQSIAVDLAGHAYIAGETGSFNFPVTNAFQSAYGGGDYDAFVAKLSPDGTSLLFSTFLGSTDRDEALGIALDRDANPFVTGHTHSSKFPTTNALYATKAAGRDVFVAGFDPFGNLAYSTFLGGRADDEGWAIAIDAAGDIHVAGVTRSSDFPTTNALQTVYAGNRDGFVAKLQADGQALVYSTFLGGKQNDEARALTLDATGNAFVVGYTSSPDFPVVPATNTLQQTFGGGTGDAFMAKIFPGSAMLALRQTPSELMMLSWPATLTGYAVESNTNLAETNDWTWLDRTPLVTNDLRTLVVTNSARNDFYRLRRID